MKTYRYLTRTTATLKRASLTLPAITTVFNASAGKAKLLCVTLQQLENGSMTFTLQSTNNSPVDGGNPSDDDTECNITMGESDQLWGIAYTCVILGLFSILIFSLMLKSLTDDENDYMISEVSLERFWFADLLFSDLPWIVSI